VNNRKGIPPRRRARSALLAAALTAGLFICAAAPTTARAAAAPSYARITSSSALLYNAADEALFLLPQNYYVLLTDTTTVPDRYAVKYDDITGYVNSADMDIVDYVPKYPYASGQTLRIENELGNAPLRRRPNVTSEVLTDIPLNAADVKFYNLSDAGGAWYYVAYGEHKGYVNKAFAVISQAIAPASDEAEPVIPDPPDPDGVTAPQPMTFIQTLILVTATAVPALIILFLIFTPRKTPPSAKSRRPVRIPRYYEDE
jgi:hypothetical protein